MTSFMYGSFSQFSKFNQREGSLPLGIRLVSRGLWANQTWRVYDSICMANRYDNQHRQTLFPEIRLTLWTPKIIRFWKDSAFYIVDYVLPVLSDANKMEVNRLHKIFKLAALFVTCRFCYTTNVINLK